MDFLASDPVHRLEAPVAEAEPLHLGVVTHAAVEVPRAGEIQDRKSEHGSARNGPDVRISNRV